MLPIKGYVKNYHWGRKASDSTIARFETTSSSDCAQDHGKTINNNDEHRHDQPLAELWFGLHPSGPATVVVGNQCIRLDSFLSREPEFIGSIQHYHKYNKKLPFLFKILSIAQPLSLQAHPDKALARQLHDKDPKNYPDSNHKPELAIALTDFEVLCDFRPHKEIAHHMKLSASFRKLVGGDKSIEDYSQCTNSEQLKGSLRDYFKTLMTCNKETITRETNNFFSNDAGHLDKDLVNVMKTFNSLYPGDPAIFAPLILNYLKLSPGQTIYLRPNKLHAYIKGECIECMACSDNVVRVGLTTKFKDMDTLFHMLDWETVKNAKDVLFAGIEDRHDSSIISFAPTDEFRVDKITLNPKTAPNAEHTLPSILSGSFFVVLQGKATARGFFDSKVEHKLALGSSGFIPPKVGLKLYNIQGTMIIYRSYCN